MPVVLELLRYARARFGEGWQGSACRRRKASEDEFTPSEGGVVVWLQAVSDGSVCSVTGVLTDKKAYPSG